MDHDEPNDQDDDYFTIRPAGRHVLTIGRDLIQDAYAAIIELVKNAYDADSKSVDIHFSANEDTSGYTVTILDEGHGMTRDTVISKWLVPSTADKLERGKSPRGRVMQGRKGVGRYAASILGDQLLLETVDENKNKTTVFLDWSAFEKAEYLSDVEVLVEASSSNEHCGTRLTISGDQQRLWEWDYKQFEKLRFELKKLLPPIQQSDTDSALDVDFLIFLKVTGFSTILDIEEEIKPYPIFDLFDYRVTGKIEPSGLGQFIYVQQRNGPPEEESFSFVFDEKFACGGLTFDIRAYDREKEAIESLIERGLRDDKGNYVGKNQARTLLNEYNGIGVYRNGFRIRPLGDADFDWLKLNEQRVQNPSLRIGSNQVIGFVEIGAEETSGLEEKSARDGLRENAAYWRLRKVTNQVISFLEERRYAYRRKTGLGRKTIKIERELESLFSFESLKEEVARQLNKRGVDKKITDDVVHLIELESEQKSKTEEEIRNAVAVYQGQATLGRIINVVLHEGRRPLNYFKNQVPNLNLWFDHYSTTKDPNDLNKLLSIAEGFGHNAEFLVDLFAKIDPLAAGKRSPKEQISIRSIIESSLAVFERAIAKEGIFVEIEGTHKPSLTAWRQDIMAIFANLIDNSLHWLCHKQPNDRRVTFRILSDDSGAFSAVDYRDSGPGIPHHLIEGGVIFDPEFSTKPSGTGLGLAIAGEAAHRNDLELRALSSSSGAYFRLQKNN